MKTAVVSFADGGQGGEYQRKMKRLESSLKGNFDGDFLGFTDYKEIGCEPHSVIPYKFKPYAISEALRLGYELILWMDSPIVAIKPLHDYVEYVRTHGHAFYRNHGHPLGKWCNDKALNWYGLTREQAMNIDQIMACCMGFVYHEKFPAVCNWFGEYKGVADDLYPGSWDNHRHDQTVASILINKYKLPLLDGHETFFIYTHFRNVWKCSETVCLESK